jgi:hypothetical protein
MFIEVELRLVLGRGNDRHDHRAPFRGRPDVDERHPVALRGQLFPKVEKLGVIDELVVVADVEAELLFRRGQLGLGRGCGEADKNSDEDDGDGFDS